MDEEIRAEFIKGGFRFQEDEEEVLKKCLTFCVNYRLKPSDLVSSWELYYLNRHLVDSVVMDGEMEGFLFHIQNEQKEAAIVKEEPDLHIYSSKDIDMILNDEEEDLKESLLRTPPNKSVKHEPEPFDSAPRSTRTPYTSVKTSGLVTPFGRRMDKFVVKFSINNLLDAENGDNIDENNENDIIKRVQPHKRCSLVVHKSGPEPGCQFMYDKIEDRFNGFENRIRKHAAALADSGLYEEPMDPTVASQRNVFAVGMICNDGESRLNDQSIILQCSVEHAGGRNVRLDLQKLSHFSIFPGQIVGIEGHNPSGHCLIASKLVDSAPLRASADTNLHPAKKQAVVPPFLKIQNRVATQALDQETHPMDSSHQKEMSALIASGPFTTTDNLLFEPLTELLAYASRKSAQLLILLGPFVDSEHPDIKKGTVDHSFDEIFDVEALKRLQDYVEYMGSDAHVVLVPSIRDANHDFVFPQPIFDVNPPNLKHQITSLTNPGIFEANQVKVGCCTVDILKQLSGEEMSRTPSDGTRSDRMSRLATHIISQRSFYPLYPPAEDIPLDFSLAAEALDITSVPDILILPSDLNSFIKILSVGEGEEQRNCICINPGRLAKGEGAGTFAELNYGGSPDKMNASIIVI